ncbi:hypothetical protein SLA2020_046470 [Shorea laevis]
MAQSHTFKILDKSYISPPVGFMPPTTLPLITFFDIPWFHSPPLHSLFFYQLPYPTLHFTETTLPILKHSLSLTLQHFFPLAANIYCPPAPLKPDIRYIEGDSISFSVAECTKDFNHLKANYLRDVKLLHPFVPQLPVARSSSDGTHVFPIMALQVTVFPNFGICVGVTHCHMAADGISLMHFMRSWASVCKSKGELACLDSTSLPSHNREVIKDPCGCDAIFLGEYWKWISSGRVNPVQNHDEKPNMVRSTFIMTQAHISGLKQWVRTLCMNNTTSEQIHVSAFVVTCAFMWVCLIQSEKNESGNVDDNSMYYFIFSVDCRDRVNEFPLPSTYFGNCTAPGIVKMKKSELIGKNGILMAAKAIGSKVKEMEEELLKGADRWLSKLEEMLRSGHITAVSGSPKMRIYDVDFGWGKPEKVEFVHIDSGGTLGISECRNEKGGIEVMLALSVVQMDAFTSIFEQNLKLFS